jgi:hypothetical protein
MASVFNPGNIAAKFDSILKSGTQGVIDVKGSPINKEIIEANRYGPAVPFTGILRNLQSTDSKSSNCFLKESLPLPPYIDSNNKLGYGSNKSLTSTSNCSPFINDNRLQFTDNDLNKMFLDIPTTTRIRILLYEIAELNDKSNSFYEQRGKNAVDILSNQGNDSEAIPSYRLTYMNRRQTAASSNTISWLITIAFLVIWAGTASYLYFNGALQGTSEKIIVSVVPISIIILLIFGFIFVENYQIQMSNIG